MYLEYRKVGLMKNKKNETKTSVASILFYVAAVLFLCIAAFSIWQAYLTVQSYQMQYTLKISDILNLYFSGSAQYFAYAIILYGIGVVLGKVNALAFALPNCECGECNEEATMDELDTLLTEEAVTEESVIEEPVKDESVEKIIEEIKEDAQSDAN